MKTIPGLPGIPTILPKATFTNIIHARDILIMGTITMFPLPMTTVTMTFKDACKIKAT